LYVCCVPSHARFIEVASGSEELVTLAPFDPDDEADKEGGIKAMVGAEVCALDIGEKSVEKVKSVDVVEGGPIEADAEDKILPKTELLLTVSAAVVEADGTNPAANDDVLSGTESKSTVLVLPAADETNVEGPELADMLARLLMLPLVGREVAIELAVLKKSDVLADTLLGPVAVVLLTCWLPSDDTCIDVVEDDSPVSYDDWPFDTPVLDCDVSNVVCVLDTSLAVTVGVLYIGSRDCDTE